MSEQRCLDCDTREAAGGYCSKCLGRHLDFFKPERSEAQKAVAVSAAQKRAAASKETANPSIVGGPS